jgi:hypothetical protein
MFCVLVPARKLLLIIALFGAPGCIGEVNGRQGGDNGWALDGWQEVRIDLPGPDDVDYLRKPLPNVWVGTEQYRRLRYQSWEIDLPVQMGGREPLNLYAGRDSLGVILHFVESHATTSVHLQTMQVREEAGAPDSLGQFVGALVSPEIRDLRFVPASESGPVEFGP